MSVINLKNRPPDYALGQKGVKWFERFEGKLREEIAFLKSMEPEELYEYIHNKKFEKEILGE